MIDRTEYATIQKILHWLMAILVIGSAAGGLMMTELGWPDPETAKTTNFLYSMHKSTGFVLLGLIILRVLARLAYSAPLQEPTVPGIQRAAAGAVHLGLYALLIAMPILGWLATSTGSYMEPVFGLFPMPDFTASMACGWLAPVSDALGSTFCAEFTALPPKEQAEQIFELHELAGLGILGLAGVHILAALYHGLIRQDGVLARMWFRRPTPERLN